ncbi:hypothetical protein O7606_22815 [Micromonospora sp. WMMD882]|uniref:hypothetical protein n=1 Tax=Micromonospora sp. WMMD882 TaxID=3015151 RepID=UPI00248A8F8C|nr:hypothetical protein [Micromonospora sp. WMMD882]WBB78993.1 hypothetical protein O7606_22815 [Micromonospora sp. WMMD882]
MAYFLCVAWRISSRHGSLDRGRNGAWEHGGVNSAVQTGYVPPSGPSRPERGLPRWLVVATVLWALLLTALTWLSVREDGPTVREQRTLAEAGPVVDRAIGDLVAAAGPDALVALEPARVERGCRVTPFSDGGTLERAVTVRVVGVEPDDLLDRVAGTLPDRYDAGVILTREGPRLRADAGEFVTVRGRRTEDGALRLTADTGCRPVGDGYPSAPVTGAEAEVAAVGAALRALGRPAADQPDLVAVPCPDGDGLLRTARATVDAGPPPAGGPEPAPSAGGPGTASPSAGGPGASPEAAALGALAGGSVVADTADVYAYRVGSVTVQAHLGDDPPTVTATSGCR